jgi:hypothetical protein
MKNYALALAAVILLIILSAAGQQKQRSEVPVVIHTRADAVQAMDQIQSEMAELDQHQQKCFEAARKLAELYSGLSQKADAVARAAGAFKSGKPANPGNNGMISSSSGSDTSGQLMAATQQMQETQMSFNLQYLQLQETMQNENRQYTMVSNIMKTKNDTVKNSISNIR